MIIKTQIKGNDTIALMLKHHGRNRDNKLKEIFHKYGNEMRNYIIRGMRDTPKAPWSYKRGKGRFHFPSLPGAFPAIDRDRLVSQIKYFSSSRYLKVGVMDDVPYGKFLETGTRKMYARPFIKPTMTAFVPRVKNSIMEAIRETIKK